MNTSNYVPFHENDHRGHSNNQGDTTKQGSTDTSSSSSSSNGQTVLL